MPELQRESLSEEKERVMHKDLLHDLSDKVQSTDTGKEITHTQSDLNWTCDDVDFSHIDEKRVLQKLDLHILPMLTLLYLLSFLDRGRFLDARD